MKLLIGVESCTRDMRRGDHDVIRSTWGRDVKNARLLFFVGQDPYNLYCPFQDEVIVDAPDDYDSLTLKTIEIVRFAYEGGYEFLFKVDTDSFLIPDKLMKCGFEQFDYYGLSRPTERIGQQFFYCARDRDGIDHPLEKCWPWCSGGYGYHLSRKAMEVILAAPKPTSKVMVWCEDLFVGQCLGPLVRDGKIKMGNADYMNKIVFHFPQYRFQSQYHPRFRWQEELYKQHHAS